MQAAAKNTNVVEIIKNAMASKMESAAFNSWIAPLRFEISDNSLLVFSPNQFSADFVSRVYLSAIESVASEFGFSVLLNVDGVAKNVNIGSANDNSLKTFTPTPQATIQNVSFDKFISSDENTFVLSACKKLASGSASFSPLFIYGPSGSGKTLLAECINTAAKGRTLMMTGGGFVSEFIRAMHDHSVFAFKDFCRNCDTFIMDDIQVLSGKRASIDEFMQLIIDLRAANKNIVLISNVAPAALSGFDRRAQSLFASGLVADVAAPNKNIKKTMLMRGGVIADVADILSSRIDGDGHLISGVAKKIETYSELMNERVTIQIAEKLLSDILQKNKTPLSMVKSMSEKLGVSFDAVCGTSRSRTIVRSRQIMMTALKSATNLSLAEIGRLIGDRDHATVLYSLNQINIAASSDLILSAQIDQMIAECK